jgi:hypothetical protein
MDYVPIDGHGSAVLWCVDDGIAYYALSAQRTLLDLGVQKTNAPGRASRRFDTPDPSGLSDRLAVPAVSIFIVLPERPRIQVLPE